MAILALGSRRLGFAAAAAASGVLASSCARSFSVAAAAPSSLHDFTVTSIDGEKVDLGRYKGKVCVLVNVASK